MHTHNLFDVITMYVIMFFFSSSEIQESAAGTTTRKRRNALHVEQRPLPTAKQTNHTEWKLWCEEQMEKMEANTAADGHYRRTRPFGLGLDTGCRFGRHQYIGSTSGEKKRSRKIIPKNTIEICGNAVAVTHACLAGISIVYVLLCCIETNNHTHTRAYERIPIYVDKICKASDKPRKYVNRVSFFGR